MSCNNILILYAVFVYGFSGLYLDKLYKSNVWKF